MITKPRTSADTQPYWDACKRRELLYQSCGACRETVFHPRAVCPYCLSDELTWLKSSGRGAIYSFTLQHVPLHASRPGRLPRALGIAALEEGFHMFTEFLAEEHSLIHIDAPIEVVFDAVSDDVVLPKFKVVAR